MIGQTIAHYRIIEKLGGGGMGVVYKAEETRLHRFIALKFLPPEVARDPQALAASSARPKPRPHRNHPNICTIHDIGEQDGQVFIAMELLEGETLKHRIEGKALKVDQVLQSRLRCRYSGLHVARAGSRRKPRGAHGYGWLIRM